jgi:transposase InsO family protein
MKVSRSSYYAWIKNHESNRTKRDKELTEMIGIIFHEGHMTYGSRRIKKQLAKKNIIASRCRIIRLMREAGLECISKRKFKATTDSKHNKQISPNLLQREFNTTAANLYWVGDITYVPTEEGWFYLATVIDLYSRKVVGWSMASTMKAELVNNALLMAI